MPIDKNLRTAYSREELNRLFWSYDKNEDCRLGWKKLKEAFKELGVLFPGYTAYRALHFADQNGDGYISEDEMDDLLHYAQQLDCAKQSYRVYSKQRMKDMIRRFDYNGDGRLGKRELKQLFAALGASIPSYRAITALLYADQNRDGYITEKEEVDKLIDYIWKLDYKIQ